jgi:hypothetical protein
MDEVGEQFRAGELFVPEMLRAAQVMKAGLEILKPHLSAGQSKSKGVVVIGTVKGDLHDIGKNLVSMMMEGAGFEVVDLGVDVEREKFVKTAAEKSAGDPGLCRPDRCRRLQCRCPGSSQAGQAACGVGRMTVAIAKGLDGAIIAHSIPFQRIANYFSQESEKKFAISQRNFLFRNSAESNVNLNQFYKFG